MFLPFFWNNLLQNVGSNAEQKITHCLSDKVKPSLIAKRVCP
jgi:hypothetical protein